MIKDVNKALRLADSKIPDILRQYEQFLGQKIRFDNPDVLKLMPERGYTAKTTAPVYVAESPAAHLHVIAFAAGDGTGNDSAYTADQLAIPADLQFSKKQERVFPRSKLGEGVYKEGFFPFMTICDGVCIPNTACLDALTVNEDEESYGYPILLKYRLGITPEMFNRVVESKGSFLSPHQKSLIVQLTTGESMGKRFGDPHAIHYSTRGIRKNTLNQDTLQVVGFLPVADKSSPLCKILDSRVQLVWLPGD